ncbi:MAG: family N-acetyltransferase [Myxococcales bacterium]|nr:family N-acetyltransferase [Myxococcales bacterium]
MSDVRVVHSHKLSDPDREALRRLLDEAYQGDFSDDDWAHALGGWHVLVGDAASPIAHASVVERRMIVGARELRAGYVEAVATLRARQRTGLGTTVMETIGNLIRSRFDVGLLSTGEHSFYERLGWERWRGPSYVRGTGGTAARSTDDDDGIMVLRCAASLDLDATAAIACEMRSGDSW